MIRLACNRCGRTLKRPPVDGMGPKCLRMTTGAKPMRRRAARRRDVRTLDLFAEAQA
jgi:hypothetical protein